MTNKNLLRLNRRIRLVLACAMMSGAFQFNGCFDSDIAKRFREAYAPGLIQGLSTAFAQPGQAEAGFRQTGVALAQAIGAIIQPRTPLSSNSSSGSSSSGSTSGSSSSSSSGSGSNSNGSG